ncbi:hypothetical protein V7968_41840 [Nocardia vulneris]|uniref:hypothetical protein n=1 Tax=Nocardia vulneris TaxID=1141657 RepID=UPI0030D0C493
MEGNWGVALGAWLWIVADIFAAFDTEPTEVEPLEFVTACRLIAQRRTMFAT